MNASLLLCLALAPGCARAAEPAPSMTLRAFVEGTLKNNQDALAQRFNVTSAEAQVSINRLMPDPQLTTGVSSLELYGPERPVSPTQVTLGLAWTLETGGKRAARMAMAGDGVRKARIPSIDSTHFSLDRRQGLLVQADTFNFLNASSCNVSLRESKISFLRLCS